MNKSVFLLDFQDSFTFQIYSELLKSNPHLKIKVIPLEKIHNFLKEENTGYYIFGPGPGHPQDYSYLFSSISKVINNLENHILGICLGHQIICHLKGLSITQAKWPIHGKQIRYTLNQELQKSLSLPHEIFVQRYNSLAVQRESDKQLSWPEIYLYYDDELIIAKDKNILSFQFHPESIGTLKTQQFFKNFLGVLCR